MATPVTSIDPRSGKVIRTVTVETSPEAVEKICLGAHHAAPAFLELGRSWRAHLLRTMSHGLEQARSEIVAMADSETALGEGRLNGELTRTCYQLELFAEAVEEGSYLEATIDHPTDTPMGPRPDLRRMLVPVGPTGVFAASNFPLAFSVPGGDTAAALAAGCPVVVKAHPSHPATSELCCQVLRAAAGSHGAPAGVLSLVHGEQAGIDLLTHPNIKAAGFTGSLNGGRALARIAVQREEPIPFYAEMGSLNPLVITQTAADERGEDIGDGLAESVLLGAGQFCTKPGLALIPHGPGGDRLVEAVARKLDAAEPAIALNERIAASHAQSSAALGEDRGLRRITKARTIGDGYQLAAGAFTIAADKLSADLTQECFGPTIILAIYHSNEELLQVTEELPASLTATLHTGTQDTGIPPRLISNLAAKAGRIVFNGFPTGVAVSHAQHHGGPWPATNSLHTSVGTTSIRRFLRPLAWQDAPETSLPEELRETTRSVSRRVDGAIQLST